MRHYVWALLIALVVVMDGVNTTLAALLPPSQADMNQQNGPNGLDDGPVSDGEF